MSLSSRPIVSALVMGLVAFSLITYLIKRIGESKVKSYQNGNDTAALSVYSENEGETEPPTLSDVEFLRKLKSQREWIYLKVKKDIASW